MKRLEDICRQRGIALTHQRRVIFQTVCQYGGHPSPEGVYDRIQPDLPSISLATVYKNLKLFAELNLLREVSQPGSRKARYEVNLEPHHHLVCTGCGKMADVRVATPEVFLPSAEELEGFVIRDSKFYFEGLCPTCQRLERTSVDGGF